MKIALLFISTIVIITSSCTAKKLITSHSNDAKDNATLIIMSYPEEIVKTTEAFYSKLLPYLGMGIPGYIRAGHACMILIKDGSDKFEYFDCGRYIAPEGYARVRGENTDPETAVDVKAVWVDGKLTNIEDLLQWLYDNPQKTRGYGDLYASISEDINYERVKKYIGELQDIGCIKYGPFDKDGSNCSRFVTDAMLNGVLDEDIQDNINKLYNLTPSVLGNVDAANDYYYIATKDSVYTSTNCLKKIQKEMLFDKGKGYSHVTDSQKGKLTEPIESKEDESWQWLGGLGYGVWYEIEHTPCTYTYMITQYCAEGKEMFSAKYQSKSELDLSKGYKFCYPSHYDRVTINVDSNIITLTRVE